MARSRPLRPRRLPLDFLRLGSGWDIHFLYAVNVVGRVILLYSGLSAHYAILYTLFTMTMLASDTL